MALLDWVPKYIKQVLNRPPRYKVTAKEYNELFNLLIEQGDYNAATLKELLKLQIEHRRSCSTNMMNATTQSRNWISICKVEILSLKLKFLRLYPETWVMAPSAIRQCGYYTDGSLDALGNQRIQFYKSLMNGRIVKLSLTIL